MSPALFGKSDSSCHRILPKARQLFGAFPEQEEKHAGWF